MAGRLTVDYLFKRSNDSQIKEIISELIKTIDHKILEAHHTGMSKLSYELPENFSINNMSRRDAQLVIYSRLIEHYEENGFRVETDLRPDPEGSYLILYWYSTLDPVEKKRMERIIDKHSIRKYK